VTYDTQTGPKAARRRVLRGGLIGFETSRLKSSGSTNRRKRAVGDSWADRNSVHRINRRVRIGGIRVELAASCWIRLPGRYLHISRFWADIQREVENFTEPLPGCGTQLRTTCQYSSGHQFGTIARRSLSQVDCYRLDRVECNNGSPRIVAYDPHGYRFSNGALRALCHDRAGWRRRRDPISCSGISGHHLCSVCERLPQDQKNVYAGPNCG